MRGETTHVRGFRNLKRPQGGLILIWVVEASESAFNGERKQHRLRERSINLRRPQKMTSGLFP